MFTTIIIQPLFNLLVLIYALLPGHNFGLAIILFTVIIRLLMWPLLKRQLHQTKAMRLLAPELKKIKKAAAGDRQKESRLTMELYKERGVNPFGTIGLTIVQAVIFIGLYLGLRRVINNPQQIISFSYSGLHHLGWLKTLGGNIHQFNDSLFGADLSRKAFGTAGTYWPAIIIAAAAAVAQYFQAKQLLPRDPDARGLRAILGDATAGRSADQAEVNAAVGRMTIFFIPGLVFLAGLSFPAALPLYWLVGSLVAYWQQTIILREDETEMKATVASNSPVVTIRSAKSSPKRRSATKTRRKKR